MRRLASLLLALALGALLAAPVAALQPIPLNPQVTQATIASTICVPRWTASVRPPVSYTDKLKLQLMDAAGISRDRADAYELDHREPLALGGAPRDRANLVLQPLDGPAGAKVKDKLEARLSRLVCAGKLLLAEAQACIWSDWRACARRHP